jgi:DNA-binding NtrC family response regulator
MENVIERSVALTDGDVIDRADLPPQIAGLPGNDSPLPVTRLPDEGIDLPAFMAMVERELLLQALDRGNGVKARAAALLGLNRTTLVEKLKRQGLGIGD